MNNQWGDFSLMRKNIEDEEERLKNYYAQSFFPTNTNNPIDVGQSKLGQTPQALAPLGSNARVVDPQLDAVKGLDIQKIDIGQVENIKWDSTFKAPEYQAELGDAAKSNAKVSGGGGADIASGVGAGLGFASTAYSSIKDVDASESESWGKTGQLALSGASTGMQIGGPWGAAIGAVVGGAAGIINMEGDRKKRHIATREKNKKQYEDTFDKRQRDYELKEAEREIELLTSFSKSQLNYLK